MIDDLLVIIPARGGSKGIPGKNTKLLGGKPLVSYSINTARMLTEDKHICLSTDDQTIAELAESAGLKVPFMRPPQLSGDNSGTYEVLLHAIDHYAQLGKHYRHVLLLQPTSPFRKQEDIAKAMEIYQSKRPEMLVSVALSSANPYYNLFEENDSGLLVKSKSSSFTRRQDCPPVYAYNGSMYFIRVETLRQKPLHLFKEIIKFEMDEISSLDLDTPLDWAFAEFVLEQGL